MSTRSPQEAPVSAQLFPSQALVTWTAPAVRAGALSAALPAPPVLAAA